MNKIINLYILIIILYTASCVKNDNFKEITKAYYKIEYKLEKDSNNINLIIKLSPKEGFYLNGNDYPPIQIKIQDKSNIIIKNKNLSIEGINKKSSYTWKIKIDNAPESFDLNIKLTAVACNDEICKIIQDLLTLECSL